MLFYVEKAQRKKFESTGKMGGIVHLIRVEQPCTLLELYCILFPGLYETHVTGSIA